MNFQIRPSSSKLPSRNYNSNDQEIEFIGKNKNDFNFLNELGRGSYGTVYKVESLINKQIYVIKKIDISNLNMKKRKDALKEVQILRKIRHENIIRYYTSFLENGCLHIVMEYASGGDMQKLIAQKKAKKETFSEPELWKFAQQLCEALNYLHAHQIIHRDIKTMNIFLDSNNKIKIGDLGVSKIVSNDIALPGTRVGTPLYLSPELVQHQPYDNKVDVWACGCVLYLLTNFESPFIGENLITLGFNIVNKEPKQINSKYSRKLEKFISLMLEKLLKNRPSIKEMLDFIPMEKDWSYSEKRMDTSKSEKHFVPNLKQQEEKVDKIDKKFDNVAKSLEKFEENKEKEILHKKTLEVLLTEKSQINNKNNNNFEISVKRIENQTTKLATMENQEKIPEIYHNELKEKQTSKAEDHLDPKIVNSKKFNFKIRPFSASHAKRDISHEVPFPEHDQKMASPKSKHEIWRNPFNNRPQSAIVNRKVNLEKEDENKEKIVVFEKINTDRILKIEENEVINIRSVTSELKNYAEAFKPVGFYMEDGNSNGFQSLNSNEFFKIFQIQQKPVGNTCKTKININANNASTLGIKQWSGGKEENFSTVSTWKILRAFPLNKSVSTLKNRKGEENAKISFFTAPPIACSSKKKFTLKDLED